jgi:hypothetical protein
VHSKYVMWVGMFTVYNLHKLVHVGSYHKILPPQNYILGKFSTLINL